MQSWIKIDWMARVMDEKGDDFGLLNSFTRKALSDGINLRSLQIKWHTSILGYEFLSDRGIW
jgi:hypothetical protein